MYSQRNSVVRGIAGGIFLIGLALSFAFGGFHLEIFFIALALSTLVGAFSTLNPRKVYGGIMGAVWFLMIALFFVTHSWVWFLVGAGISMIMGALIKPIIAGLMGISVLGAASTYNQQPNYVPPQQTYQPYEGGYSQEQRPQETYQEGGQSYSYPSPTMQEEEQAQAQYPQQMPPQQ